MNENALVRIGLMAVSCALAAMGCWFCWNCPMDWIQGPNLHSVFVRQVVWNGIGLVLFAGASLLRWKWWQKSAPWLLVAWTLLAVWSFAFGSPVKGSHRWVCLGLVRIDLGTTFVLVSALSASWFVARERARPWMIVAAIGGLLVFGGVNAVFSDGARLARFFSRYGTGWAHDQYKAAFDVAKWFGAAGRGLRHLPNPLNDGMAAASALVFGKWFPIAVLGLFAALGGLLSAIWLHVGDSSRRMFLLVWGAGMLAPAVYGFLQCVGLVPVTGCSPVLVGYGGTSAMVFWLGLGMLFSLVREGEGLLAHAEYGPFHGRNRPTNRLRRPMVSSWKPPVGAFRRTAH